MAESDWARLSFRELQRRIPEPARRRFPAGDLMLMVGRADGRVGLGSIRVGRREGAGSRRFGKAEGRAARPRSLRGFAHADSQGQRNISHQGRDDALERGGVQRRRQTCVLLLPEHASTEGGVSILAAPARRLAQYNRTWRLPGQDNREQARVGISRSHRRYRGGFSAQPHGFGGACRGCVRPIREAVVGSGLVRGQHEPPRLQARGPGSGLDVSGRPRSSGRDNGRGRYDLSGQRL